MAERILVRGGEVVDPGLGISRQRRDVLVADGKIAAVTESISAEPGDTVVDARGKLVTPGLIDLHTHVNYGGDGHSVQPDVVAAYSGTTTLVDAGSAGSTNFLGFRRYVIRPSK